MITAMVAIAVISSTLTILYIAHVNKPNIPAPRVKNIVSNISLHTASNICTDETYFHFNDKNIHSLNFDNRSSIFDKEGNQYRIYMDIVFNSKNKKNESLHIICEIAYKNGKLNRYLVQGRDDPNVFFHTIRKTFKNW